MDRQQALEVLRLQDKHITDQDIEKAFQKLIRRYPPEMFPEKSIEMRKAYSLLSNADDFWKDFINQRSPDFSFIAPYLKTNGQHEARLKDLDIEKLSEKELLQQISAPLLTFFFRGHELEHDDFDDDYF